MREGSLSRTYRCLALSTGLGLVALTAGCAPESPDASGAALDTPAAAHSSALVSSDTRVLVSFSGGSVPANASALIASAGGTLVTTYPNLGLALAKGPASLGTSLRAKAGVDAVGAVTAAVSSISPLKGRGTHHAAATVRAPGADPLSNRQWDMDQIRAPQARAISAGKKSVLVGVFDSGIDRTHPDLVGQVDSASSASCLGGVANPDPAVWANDIIGHGTYVAGTIAGAKNGVGIVGVAPGVRVAAVKVAIDDLNDPNFGLVFADAMVCAIDWSIGHGFDLMNASLTIDPFTAPIDDIFCNDQPDRAAIVTMVRKAVSAAGKKNITLVAALGNFFTNLAALSGQTPGSTCQVLPAQLPRVIGVSAVGVTRLLSFYSNYGKGAVDVTGPGGDGLIPAPNVTDTTASGQVLSSVPPGSLYYQLAADWNGQVQDCSSTPAGGTCATYAYLQGTSQAVPHVTGVAALVLSRLGKLPPEGVLAALSLTAKSLPCPVGPYDPGATGTPAICTGSTSYNNFYGAGEVDALNIVH